jgi:hypothetical protein
MIAFGRIYPVRVPKAQVARQIVAYQDLSSRSSTPQTYQFGLSPVYLTMATRPLKFGPACRKHLVIVTSNRAIRTLVILGCG